MSQFTGMLLERSVTIRVAICIKAKPHFAAGKFPRCGRRCRPRRRRPFAGRGACSDKFLPEGNVRRKLPSGILLLQRLQLPFQLAQSERNPQLRRHEKRLDEKYRGKKSDNAAKKKCQAQAWPSPPGRVGENKGSPFLGKISVHQAPRADILARVAEMPKSDFSCDSFLTGNRQIPEAASRFGYFEGETPRPRAAKSPEHHSLGTVA